MSNVKKSYETVVVISTKMGDEAVSALVQKFKDLIEANATLDGVDEWGKRKLLKATTFYLTSLAKQVFRQNSTESIKLQTVCCVQS